MARRSTAAIFAALVCASIFTFGSRPAMAAFSFASASARNPAASGLIRTKALASANASGTAHLLRPVGGSGHKFSRGGGLGAAIAGPLGVSEADRAHDGVKDREQIVHLLDDHVLLETAPVVRVNRVLQDRVRRGHHPALPDV